MDISSTIAERINASIAVKQQILTDGTLLPLIESVVQVITSAFQQGNAVYFCGNGGSAADAQHLAAEFSGRFYKDRKALPSEALHCNTSYLTAVANDYSYDVIYARLIEGIAKKGDVLIGLSTSGNSANILRAFEKAAELGVITIGMTGASGGKMKGQCDYLINVPSSDTPRIQESHILIGHILCELTEKNIFG
ncbi:MAG: D-sedoheptulose 7-phosphate isomerase [Chitinophagaceae bacterium]|nr:D-sedoheptulose 7-phosphate isomerase [Chitinophagaceae bacterium]MCA6470576.1 D-sedoheptulose 7-phosphate isomerase [Chitinophagaceae bacterium]MCA6478339.1 D-sedoheptulose 7-phosphate isomerase [Chitinophagaceae bacterium]MCA6479509.1 D-sedoheptulose 7-phosphate isomerase [Chitinophagaceae bacterium]